MVRSFTSLPRFVAESPPTKAGLRLQRPSILRTPDSSAQLLGDDDAEILVGREQAMELLKRVVRTAVSKGVDEELRIEDVLSRLRRHGSASGEAISMPRIARVPSIGSRWTAFCQSDQRQT